MENFDESHLEYVLPTFIHSHTYGTAGFRGKAETLDRVMFVSGCLSALRSSERGKGIGLMITASHNPERDNGVKLVDPLGEMLAQEWEAHATALVNAPTSRDFTEILRNLFNRYAQDKSRSKDDQHPIFFGRDTRKSGPRLLQLAKDGAEFVGHSNHIDLGIVTTPQLHFAVRRYNLQLPWTEQDYYKFLAEGYRAAVRNLPKERFTEPIIVDAANGVGAPKAELLKVEIGEDHLPLRIRNVEGPLNEGVGADHVKLHQREPLGVDRNDKEDLKGRFATLDGDADRLLYFFFDNSTGSTIFNLLDGDYLAALFLTAIRQDLAHVGIPLLPEGNNVEPLSGLRVGVIQTAYANGASTNYFQSLPGVTVCCVNTGVKHLLARTLNFDVAVYFEANGHGSIAFTDEERYLKTIDRYLETASARSSQNVSLEEIHQAGSRLKGYLQLVNPAIGDALSNLLLTEAILRAKNWNLSNWWDLYKPMACRQKLVKVPNRYAITTTNAEREVVTPPTLQPRIDEAVQRFGGKGIARAFARPSGTEDVVRVYAEAPFQSDADALADEIARVIEEELNPSPSNRL